MVKVEVSKNKPFWKEDLPLKNPRSMLSDGNGMPVKYMIFRFSDSHIEKNKNTAEILLGLFNFIKSKNILMCKKMV